MDGFTLAVGSALWLGILTSISPCPLASNIAAVSFIGRRAGNTRHVLLAGVFYAVGRLFSYVGLAVIVVAGLLSIPGLAFFLQNSMNKILGPLLIVVGLVLVGAFRFTVSWLPNTGRLQARAERSGLLGAGLLGLVFALSFCPVSAALFFGSLIPLSVEHSSRVLIPSVYGLGTALPVVLSAAVLAFAAGSFGRFFARMTQVEVWLRRITGAVFIAVGAYYTLVYIFHVLS